ncbi:MAG TPA: 2-oxoglutarate dehydrogenase, E2 component, dihydrolipoamide succinyltransferase [Terriglobales bacterium]|nr:2-oxoglutarate dehydrogenase, E2 component, dihydrolipoamide succinyltransferase [Terriglobales bacterium]
MATDVIMPQMGESIFEGTITKWLKKPGEQVQRDEPLFEISTDKVDAEIPAPASGVLKEIKVQEGTTVQVNTVVGVIDSTNGASATPSAQPSTAATAPVIGSPELNPSPMPAGGPQNAAPPAPTASGPATDVIMPQMGESIFEGTITKWLKNVGDKVQRDEPLFEISTDKVDAEIPAPASGVLTEIKAQAGSTVQVNSVVGVIGGTGAPAAAPAPAAQPAAPAKAAAPAAPAPAAPVHEEEEVTVDGQKIRSSPLVRKMAKEHGINLAQVKGTGLGGRITKEDITAYIENRGKAPAAPVPVAAAPMAAKPAAPAPAPAAPLPGEVVPMTAMRKIIAQRMVESKHTSAHVHTIYEIDMTRVMNLREKIKKQFEQKNGVKLTPTTFFARAAVKGIRDFPIINSSVEGDNIRYHRNINIGIAVALDWGLIVPVIKNAEEKNIVGLQRSITDLGDRARSKKLKPDDVAGGTFTITNPGQFGQMFGLPIISQPQVAIMGIGSIKKMPVVLTDENGTDSIAIRQICHVSLGYDHRIIDGAVADQFLRSVAKFLENWNEELL